MHTAGTALPAPVVRVDLWGVPSRAIPASLLSMATDRAIRRRPGVRFAKLLGTGDGRTFTARDADLHHWALLTCIDDEAAARALDTDPVLLRWAGRSQEHLRLLLRPLASRGTWSGRRPFGNPVGGDSVAGDPAAGGPAAPRWDGPVVAVTRARLRVGRMRRFWAAVPPVSASLHAAAGSGVGGGAGAGAGAGPVLAVGIGEAPIGLQGTLSVWSDSRALTSWAYRSPEHLAAVRATPVEGWYAEELFARFGLLDARGTFDDRPLALSL